MSRADPLRVAEMTYLRAVHPSQKLSQAKQRAFAYMPYMHSESLPIHAQGGEAAILGRTSSAEELAFLSEPGSSF